MNDITLENLDAKIDALGARLDKKLDDGFAKAFEQTQGGFDEHRKFTEFVVERSATILREEMNTRFKEVDRRFNQVDRRFDGMDDRFDRLEKLIKGR